MKAVSEPFSQADLEAYLDEALPPDEMAEVEDQLRNKPELAKQLRTIHGRRDAGIHTLGEIWRRHRVSCPSREDMGSYLLKILDGEQAAYVKFHLEVVRCRLCNANLEDMQLQQQEASEMATTRRQRYFQSSAGYLQKD